MSRTSPLRENVAEVRRAAYYAREEFYRIRIIICSAVRAILAVTTVGGKPGLHRLADETCDDYDEFTSRAESGDASRHNLLSH